MMMRLEDVPEDELQECDTLPQHPKKEPLSGRVSFFYSQYSDKLR